jgi:hypothetical protein
MIIDYEGVLHDDKLLLRWRENINANYKIMEEEYFFVPFGNQRTKRNKGNDYDRKSF